LQWRNGERNIEQTSVFTAADRFIVVDSIAAPDALVDSRGAAVLAT
jgi:hypothetical protein